MQNPGKPGTGFRGACVLSLGSDAQVIPETGTPFQARAFLLDRAADFHLQLGQIRIAERLACMAAEAAEAAEAAP